MVLALTMEWITSINCLFIYCVMDWFIELLWRERNHNATVVNWAGPISHQGFSICSNRQLANKCIYHKFNRTSKCPADTIMSFIHATYTSKEITMLICIDFSHEYISVFQYFSVITIHFLDTLQNWQPGQFVTFYYQNGCRWIHAVLL